VDIIYVIVRSSYEAIKLAEKISDMSKEGRKSVHLILNKVDDKLAEKIIAKVGKGRVIGVIPFSKCVQKKGLTGQSTRPQDARYR